MSSTDNVMKQADAAVTTVVDQANHQVSILKAYFPYIQSFALDAFVALIVFVIGWAVAGIVGKAFRRLLSRSDRIDPTVVPMFVTAAEWAIKIFTIIAVLSRFGVQTASLIAILSAAGLAIGLALQGTLQNIAAGIMLLAIRPLRAGESVTVAGISGTVSEIGLFLTKIIQADGIHVTIPNSAVWSGNIVNNSRNNTRRMDLPIRLQYGEDLDKAIALLTDLANKNPQTLFEPSAPSVFVSAYQDSYIILNMRVWCAAGQYGDLTAEFLKDARQVLENNGFDLPIPVQKSSLVDKATSDTQTAS